MIKYEQKDAGEAPPYGKPAYQIAAEKIAADEVAADGHSVVRVHLHLDYALLEAVDRVWHERRLSSRAETIRVLLRGAL